MCEKRDVHVVMSAVILPPLPEGSKTAIIARFVYIIKQVGNARTRDRNWKRFVVIIYYRKTTVVVVPVVVSSPLEFFFFYYF